MPSKHQNKFKTCFIMENVMFIKSAQMVYPQGRGQEYFVLLFKKIPQTTLACGGSYLGCKEYGFSSGLRGAVNAWAERWAEPEAADVAAPNPPGPPSSPPEAHGEERPLRAVSYSKVVPLLQRT